MVGLAGGLLVKLNVMHALPKGDPSVYLASVATREPELPEGADEAKKADLDIVGPQHSAPAGAHLGSRCRREFYQAHTHEIVYLGFRGRSRREMVSVDSAGYIYLFTYSTTGFSGFGWHKPVQRFVLDLKNLEWQPKGRSKSILYKKDVDKPLEFQKQAAKSALAQFSELTELPETPWDASKTSSGGQRQVYKPNDAGVDGKKDALFHILVFDKGA